MSMILVSSLRREMVSIHDHHTHHGIRWLTDSQKSVCSGARMIVLISFKIWKGECAAYTHISVLCGENCQIHSSAHALHRCRQAEFMSNLYNDRMAFPGGQTSFREFAAIVQRNTGLSLAPHWLLYLKTQRGDVTDRNKGFVVQKRVQRQDNLDWKF